MAVLIQTVCLIFYLGMAFSWPLPLVLERHIPITYVHTSVEEGSASPSLPSSSLYDEMHRIMANMHERFEQMFKWPATFPMDYYDSDYDLRGDYDDNKLNLVPNLVDTNKQLQNVLVHNDDTLDIQKQLDAIEPICTTISDSPTTISPRKSRRKKLPVTQTKTCIKELIHNGQKHFSEEITTTDDKNVVIKHSKSYGAISIDTNQLQQ